MSTVAELIEALKRLPQDAIVKVGEGVSCGYDNTTEWNPVDTEFILVLDYHDEIYKTNPHYGTVVVKLEAK